MSELRKVVPPPAVIITDAAENADAMAKGRRPPRPLTPIDVATPDDALDLFYFLRYLRWEIGDGLVDDEAMRLMVARMANRDEGVAFLVRGPGGIEASLGIALERPWWSTTHNLRVMWSIVAPEFRARGGHARSLLLRALEFSNRVGRPLVHAELADEMETPKIRLCHRVYKNPVGVLFRHEPDNAPSPV